MDKKLERIDHYIRIGLFVEEDKRVKLRGISGTFLKSLLPVLDSFDLIDEFYSQVENINGIISTLDNLERDYIIKNLIMTNHPDRENLIRYLKGELPSNDFLESYRKNTSGFKPTKEYK
jgi:hypothetical protein